MFTAHLPITDQDASGTRDDPSRRPNKSHVAFIELSSIPPALAKGMDRLRAPHDNLVIIGKRMAPGKFRIVELSRLGEIGVINIPIPSSASFNQQGIIVIRRVSVINLMSSLGVPENVELIRMKDAIQLCKDTGITHLSDARIETIITKHLESVLHTLSCEARLYVKDDVIYIIKMMGEMVD